MPMLSAPTVDVHRSFLAAMSEFAAEGRGAPADQSMVGQEIRDYHAVWHTPDGFASYLRWLRDQARPGGSRPAGFEWVPATTLWWVDGEHYLGRIAIRHRLTERLRTLGGHIGYDVRPSARRRGHATAMLAAALPVAHALGIDPALLTCDVQNTASATVIERNGGVLDDQHGAKLRYWLRTAAGSPARC